MNRHRKQMADAPRIAYGSHPSQFVDLHPAADGSPPPWPVAVLLHGGFWRRQRTLDLMYLLAQDLTARGFAVCNVEYRRLGEGGGWPATLSDTAAAIDLLARPELSSRVDTERVISIGHSAGGHLALWAAGRPRLPAGAPGGGEVWVRVSTAVSLAGVLDLHAASRAGLGDGAVDALLGGPPAQDTRERYASASPAALLPLGVAQVIVHGGLDRTVPPAYSRAYARKAAAAGDPVWLVEDPWAHHFTPITPGSGLWLHTAALLSRNLGPFARGDSTQARITCAAIAVRVETGGTPVSRHHHVNLVVSDLERSTAFYRDYFDFRVTDPHDGMVVMQDPGGFDLVLEPGEPSPQGFHFGFRLGDLEELLALKARLDDAGITTFDAMETDFMVSYKVHDPDGYRVEVYWS